MLTESVADNGEMAENGIDVDPHTETTAGWNQFAQLFTRFHPTIEIVGDRWIQRTKEIRCSRNNRHFHEVPRIHRIFLFILRLSFVNREAERNLLDWFEDDLSSDRMWLIIMSLFCIHASPCPVLIPVRRCEQLSEGLEEWELKKKTHWYEWITRIYDSIFLVQSGFLPSLKKVEIGREIWILDTEEWTCVEDIH